MRVVTRQAAERQDAAIHPPGTCLAALSVDVTAKHRGSFICSVLSHLLSVWQLPSQHRNRLLVLEAPSEYSGYSSSCWVVLREFLRYQVQEKHWKRC